jgi:O-antigen ligase
VVLYAFTNVYLYLAIPFGLMFMVLMTINWKAAYFMLLFCIPFSIQLEFFNGTLSTSVPDEPMMWLFLLLFGVLFASRPAIMPKWWWRNPIVLVVLLQYIWLIVAVIYAEESLISTKFLIAKTWFLVSFFLFPILVFREKKDFKTAFFVVLIPLLITMIIIVYRHKQLGFNFRKIEKAINNIYYNHVDYSTVISMFFPLLIIAVPLTRGKKWWVKAALWLTILFFLPAIYLTYARAAMLAIVFAFVVAIAIRIKLVNFIIPIFYGIVITFIVFLASNNKYIEFRPNFERTYMHATFTQHMVATFQGQDMSSMERFYRWIAAVRMSKERPWTGVGPNAFYLYYKPYAVTSFRTYVSRNSEHSTTHNYYLYMLVEQGWPALVLYATLIFLVFAQAQRTYHRFKDRFYKYVTMGVIMMFAAGYINNFFSELLETHKVGGLFYISLAILVILDHKSRQEQQEGDDTTEAANSTI